MVWLPCFVEENKGVVREIVCCGVNCFVTKTEFNSNTMSWDRATNHVLNHVLNEKGVSHRFIFFEPNFGSKNYKPGWGIGTRFWFENYKPGLEPNFGFNNGLV